MKLECVNDIAEDVTDGRAHESEDDDNDDCDQHEDQSVLNKALSFFTREIQHDRFLHRMKMKFAYPMSGLIVS